MSLPETSDAFVGALAAALPPEAERYRPDGVDGFAWPSRLAARLPMDMPVFLGLAADGRPCAGVALRRGAGEDAFGERMHLLPILKDLGLAGRAVPSPQGPAGPERLAFAARFAAALDYEAVRLLVEANASDVDAYGWLAERGPDRPSRHALARAYPWAVDALLENGADLWGDNPEDVACDLLRSASLSGCGAEGTLRHLVRCSSGMAFEGFDRRELLGDLRAASFLPKDWIPADREDLVALVALAPHLLAFAAKGGHPVASTMRVNGNGWAMALRRLAQRARLPEASPRETAAALAGGVRDMTEAFHRQVAWPAAVALDPALRDRPPGLPETPGPGSLSRASHRILVGDRTFPGAVEASLRWAASLTPIADAVAACASGESLSWPAAFPPVRDRLGVMVTCISDASDMLAEGRGLGHCVCSYLPRCLAGESVIASVRSVGPDGGLRERLSTVELRWGADGSLRPAQHHGPGNGPAPDIAVLAVRRLDASLRAGRIPLTRHADPAGANATLLALYAGHCEEMTAAWSSHLPAPLRGAAPDTLLAAGLDPDAAPRAAPVPHQR